MHRSVLDPFVGAKVGIGGLFQSCAEASIWAPRLAHDARVMPAARQDECYVGIAKLVDLVDGTPGRDVIAFGTDRKLSIGAQN